MKQHPSIIKSNPQGDVLNDSEIKMTHDLLKQNEEVDLNLPQIIYEENIGIEKTNRNQYTQVLNIEVV